MRCLFGVQSCTPCIVHSLAADQGRKEMAAVLRGQNSTWRKDPTTFSSRRVRAVPPLTAAGSGEESSCTGAQLLDWPGAGWGGMSLGADCHWSLQVLPLAVKLLGFTGVKPKPSRHIR